MSLEKCNFRVIVLNEVKLGRGYGKSIFSGTSWVTTPQLIYLADSGIVVVVVR